MTLHYEPGDDLVFQLESGYGLLRVLASEERGGQRVWHLMAYEELFPDVEAAEAALANAPQSLGVRAAHLPLTEHAFEKTPVARLGNRPVRDEELEAYRGWQRSGGRVHERSALLLLGLR
jgi:hypothetical protein